MYDPSHRGLVCPQTQATSLPVSTLLRTPYVVLSKQSPSNKLAFATDMVRHVRSTVCMYSTVHTSSEERCLAPLAKGHQ